MSLKIETRFFTEFFREPDIQVGYAFYNIRYGQVLCIIMFLVGLYLMLFSLRNAKSKDIKLQN